MEHRGKSERGKERRGGCVITNIFYRNPIHTLFSGLTSPACTDVSAGRLSSLSRERGGIKRGVSLQYPTQ